MLAQGVRRRTHCALRAPFKQLRQVSARSACVLRHTHAPPALRFSARAEGNPRDIHSGHCFATLRSAPSRGRKRHTLRKLGLAQRWPVWLFGYSAIRCSAPHPCWLRLRRGGCRVSMGVGAPMPRELTRRGCPSGAAQQQSEFHGAPRNRPAAGLPLRTAKGSQTGGRLFFGDFLLAKQKKVTRMPGDSRLPHSTRECSSHRTKASTGSTQTDGARTNYKNNSCQRFV